MSKIDQLEKLAKLKQEGTLSSEEYDRMKAELLETPGTSAPANKSHTGLIIGLVIGGVLLLGGAITLAVVLGGDDAFVMEDGSLNVDAICAKATECVATGVGACKEDFAGALPAEKDIVRACLKDATMETSCDTITTCLTGG
jgi:hypothetical protein